MAKRTQRLRKNVVPDRLDLRDRPYLPAVREAPPRQLNTLSRVPIAVRNQGETSACTGFALASVIDILLTRAKRGREAKVSPFMLYSMARRYDEFPGYKADDGSSLRGALKAWYRHGACKQAMWPDLDMPGPKANPRKDWWQDSVRRPLGAYYRVDSRSVTDMQVALNEVGVLYASVVCHDGWDEGYDVGGKEWAVPRRKVRRTDGGHAIALVGYNERGFLVLNSWGTTWAARGVGVLPYEDWLDNAMDCWVTQLGVPTEQHLEVAAAVSLRREGSKVALATDVTLRNRELSPFIVNVENNGRLSNSGVFRTQESDLKALVQIHMETAVGRWQLAPNDPLDIAIYAHGGLVGEEAAADAAAHWIPALYDAQIFPIFVMWESDLLSTLRNRLADLLAVSPTETERRTAGAKDQLQRWLNERLERTFAKPGAFCWNEMKQNAEALSLDARSGLRLLYREFNQANLGAKRKVRLHLIGHSAGAVVQAYLARQLVSDNQRIDSIVFMAPALRADDFTNLIKPHLGSSVKRMATFLLDDHSEQSDTTCRALLGYGRSLLYLVSESFETDRRHMPLLGMERYFASIVGDAAGVTRFVAPGPESRAVSHGGFDDDPTTMKSVIAYIRKQK